MSNKQRVIAISLIVLLSAVLICWRIIHDKSVEKAAEPPKQEIAQTDSAIKTAETKIVIMQQRQNDLTGVVENAKSDARSRVDSYSDDDIAANWNARLEQYRKDTTSADGL